MLGMGTASQYAGWWSSSGTASVDFETTSALSYTNFQTPSYSLLSGVGGSPAQAWNIVTSGNYNLTGYTSLTDYNTQRATVVATLYLDWPTSGIPSGAFVGYTVFNELRDNGTSLYYNPVVSLTNTNTQVSISPAPGGSSNLVLDGSYTQYVGRWLTFVLCSSETSASYTNWNLDGGSSGAYNRTAVFDTELGTLLGKRDYRAAWNPGLSSFPTTTPADFSGTYGLYSGGNGSGSNPDYYNARFSNLWTSFGTMFDPLTTTNTSWRTTRPSAVIDTGVAWQNLQTTDSTIVSSNYYVTTQGMDLYTQASNLAAKTSGWTSTEWTNNFSDTIITKDSA